MFYTLFLVFVKPGIYSIMGYAHPGMDCGGNSGTPDKLPENVTEPAPVPGRGNNGWRALKMYLMDKTGV
jgi:hypothetical protein